MNHKELVREFLKKWCSIVGPDDYASKSWDELFLEIYEQYFGHKNDIKIMDITDIDILKRELKIAEITKGNWEYVQKTMGYNEDVVKYHSDRIKLIKKRMIELTQNSYIIESEEYKLLLAELKIERIRSIEWKRAFENLAHEHTVYDKYELGYSNVLFNLRKLLESEEERFDKMNNEKMVE